MAAGNVESVAPVLRVLATAVVAVAAAVVNAKAAHSANASVLTANPWQPMRRRYKAP